jgi:hypothetical protein
MFIQYVPLALYYVKLFLLGSTPRAVYNIKYTMRSIQWGTVFPNTTLLIVISAFARPTLAYVLLLLSLTPSAGATFEPAAIAYMNIQPVINGLACFSFFLLYFAYKYLFTWVYEQECVPAPDRNVLAERAPDLMQPTRPRSCSPASDTGGLFFPKAITHVFIGLYIQGASSDRLV